MRERGRPSAVPTIRSSFSKILFPQKMRARVKFADRQRSGGEILRPSAKSTLGMESYVVWHQ